MTETAPYGSWRSPITSDLIVSGTIGLGQIVLDGQALYWLESRPTEGGRSVIVGRTIAGETGDVTPPEFNVRTRVHEYGGGAYTVADGVIYFSNFADQRLYKQSPGQAPVAISPVGSFRFADGDVDHHRSRFIFICEDHTVAGQEPTNTIVSVPLGGTTDATPAVLVSGNDFYASPRLSPDGTQLAWLTWNHPNMPWDGTELWVAHVQADGTLARAIQVAGGKQESIFQPEWSPDGVLYFVSDRSGWWNLYRWHPTEAPSVQALCEMAAEFGQPQWGFRMATYGFASATDLICTYTQSGMQYLARLDPTTGKLTPIATPYSTFGGLQVTGEMAVMVAGSPTESLAIVQLDLTSMEIEVLRRSSDLAIDPGYLSVPQSITFPTTAGQTAYGFFYPPQNHDYTATLGEKPPLLVKSHGGPTAATSTAFNLKIQYWTSRGIAVLDVNYGGSTGYGRDYRERLKGNWGIVDVDDCANGAKYLAESGVVDGDRLMIDGGSAGGYTTLAALTFRDVFKAGASFYGVCDLEALAKDTHKFEARYLDGLVGPYPERQDLYIARSPVHFTAQLSCPVIFFQGLEDKIVPPNQAEMMVAALTQKGLPVAYVAFEGEQHGFRKAENIKRTLDGELYFYAKLFGFDLAEAVEPVTIVNLPSL